MQVTKCCVLLILSIVFHYYKKETSWRLSLFSGAPPLPAAKGRLPAGGLIEILQGELAGVSPTGTPSLRNRNILPKIDFDRLFQLALTKRSRQKSRTWEELRKEVPPKTFLESAECD